MTPKLFELLSRGDEYELLLDSNLEKFTTIRLSARGTLVKVFSLEALRKLIQMAVESGLRYHLVGWGANQVLLNTQDTLFIQLKFHFDNSYLKTFRKVYKLPASIGLNTLTSTAKKLGLVGWEVFTGIPASLGGAIYMNAGTNLGEIGSLVRSVTLLDKSGNLRKELISSESFSYRRNHFVLEGEIIIEAELNTLGQSDEMAQKIDDYLALRKKTQPIQTKNCGCVFKNYSKELRAGACIDKLGLKGLEYKGLRVSTLHGNFIENIGNASAQDFYDFILDIQRRLEDAYNVKFEFEVQIF